MLPDSAGAPRLVAWEITRSCNLNCAHCRASAKHGRYDGELSIEECFHVVDGITELGRPILILTGGEPLLRDDFFDIARYATSRGLRVVLGSNGTLVTAEVAGRMKATPVSRLGVSIDFPTREAQDEFRGMPGAFDAALTGIENARRAGIDVQINSTVTRMNVGHLHDLVNLALELGAVAFHPFMLVPTGRGENLTDVALTAEEHEQVLNWIFDRQGELGSRILFKPTDAPHYVRVSLQRKKAGISAHARSERPSHGEASMDSTSRGCLAGIGFCFISHVGRVQGCGYLDVEAGNVRTESFRDIWANSDLFRKLRDTSAIKGKCGACEYKRACGGCRARAYEHTGDYLEAEPFCLYQPADRRTQKIGCEG